MAHCMPARLHRPATFTKRLLDVEPSTSIGCDQLLTRGQRACLRVPPTSSTLPGWRRRQPSICEGTARCEGTHSRGEAGNGGRPCVLCKPISHEPYTTTPPHPHLPIATHLPTGCRCAHRNGTRRGRCPRASARTHRSPSHGWPGPARRAATAAAAQWRHSRRQPGCSSASGRPAALCSAPRFGASQPTSSCSL